MASSNPRQMYKKFYFRQNKKNRSRGSSAKVMTPNFQKIKEWTSNIFILKRTDKEKNNNTKF